MIKIYCQKFPKNQYKTSKCFLGTSKLAHLLGLGSAIIESCKISGFKKKFLGAQTCNLSYLGDFHREITSSRPVW